ncbi:MAG: YeeE/YedE thiosulfate transporter family protein [Nibricoccus sp.]
MFSLESCVYGLVGGVLIGVGSLLASAATGKIPGISGLVGRIFRAEAGDVAWRVIFLVGLVIGAALAIGFNEHAAAFRPVRSLAFLAVAGVLVGVGTRVGGGCTSGHGVCGMGLGSRDSLVATLLFMATAMLTVFIFHRVAGGLLP